jgi:hypothetical protein
MKGHFVFLRIVLVSLIVAPALGGEQNTSPKISFEQTVFDLGQVGLGTKNSCEFKFTNTGQWPLRILARPPAASKSEALSARTTADKNPKS